MGATIIRCDRDALDQLARIFASEAEANQIACLRLRDELDLLMGGDWVGPGAEAFYAEMASDVMPALLRFQDALRLAGSALMAISRTFFDAEDGAASILRGSIEGRTPELGSASAAIASPATEAAGSAAARSDSDPAESATNGLFSSLADRIRSYFTSSDDKDGLRGKPSPQYTPGPGEERGGMEDWGGLIRNQDERDRQPSPSP